MVRANMLDTEGVVVGHLVMVGFFEPHLYSPVLGGVPEKSLLNMLRFS